LVELSKAAGREVGAETSNHEMTKSLHGDPGTFRRFDSIQTLALVSDTHGLLRESVVAALQKVDLIVHAGDVGPRSLLRRLETIAPVVAVRGNVDSELAYLAPTELICVNEQLIFVLHDLSMLELDPAVAGLAMVVSGHSHQPKIDRRCGVLYVNPGSIGPKRFSLPVSFAKVAFEGPDFVVELVLLDEQFSR
jgi:putative phosphoesterase